MLSALNCTVEEVAQLDQKHLRNHQGYCNLPLPVGSAERFVLLPGSPCVLRWLAELLRICCMWSDLQPKQYNQTLLCKNILHGVWGTACQKMCVCVWEEISTSGMRWYACQLGEMCEYMSDPAWSSLKKSRLERSCSCRRCSCLCHGISASMQQHDHMDADLAGLMRSTTPAPGLTIWQRAVNNITSKMMTSHKLLR